MSNETPDCRCAGPQFNEDTPCPVPGHMDFKKSLYKPTVEDRIAEHMKKTPAEMAAALVALEDEAAKQRNMLKIVPRKFPVLPLGKDEDPKFAAITTTDGDVAIRFSCLLFVPYREKLERIEELALSALARGGLRPASREVSLFARTCDGGRGGGYSRIRIGKRDTEIDLFDVEDPNLVRVIEPKPSPAQSIVDNRHLRRAASKKSRRTG